MPSMSWSRPVCHMYKHWSSRQLLLHLPLTFVLTSSFPHPPTFIHQLSFKSFFCSFLSRDFSFHLNFPPSLSSSSPQIPSHNSPVITPSRRYADLALNCARPAQPLPPRGASHPHWTPLAFPTPQNAGSARVGGGGERGIIGILTLPSLKIICSFAGQSINSGEWQGLE